MSSGESLFAQKLIFVMQRLFQSSTMRAIGTMVGATGLGQLAVLATLPMLTRLYSPYEFGLHALIISFVSVASVGSCLCLELVIVQARTPEDADELCSAALLSTFFTASISLLILSILIGAECLGYGKLPWWGGAMAAAMVCFNGLYTASRYRLLREQRFTVMARATLWQSGGRALAPLLWFLIFPSWIGLSFGELSGRTLGLSGLLRPLLPQLMLNNAWGSLRAWWRIVQRERSYTGFFLVTVLMDSCASLMIAPLLAWGYGAASAGEYFLVATILVAPSALIGTAVADVIHTRGAFLLLESPQKLTAFLSFAATLLLIVGSIIYISLYFLAPYIIPLLFGEKWTLATLITQSLTPLMIVSFVASPSSRLLLVVNRPNFKVISDIVRLIGTPAVIIIAKFINWPFLLAIWVMSCFLAMAYAFYFGLTWLAVYQVSKDNHAS
jgi:lipopolysaccharide exporter